MTDQRCHGDILKHAMNRLVFCQAAHMDAHAGRLTMTSLHFLKAKPLLLLQEHKLSNVRQSVWQPGFFSDR